MNEHVEALYRAYPTHFSRSLVAHARPSEEVVMIVSADTLHQDTIGDSNVTTVYNYLDGAFPGMVEKQWKPYVDTVQVKVEDLEQSEELTELVQEVLEALDNYPVFDEGDYSDLETERLMTYINNDLPCDLSLELGIDDDDHLQVWLQRLDHDLYDFNDGSVDDAPFNVEALAEQYRADHGIVTE